MLVADRGDSFVVDAARVTGEFFDVLGAAAILGRGLRPEDDRTGAENVLVLSHGLWRGRFGADPGALGRRITVGGQPFTIVGVMGRDVDHPRRVEAWTTVAAMQSTTTSPLAKAAMASELYLFARVSPGTSVAVAAEELRSLAPALDALRSAGADRGFVPHVQSYRDHLVGDVRGALAVLFGAVGFVLLLACANVAGLCLVRSDARCGEFAVRAALGAGPGQLARQVFAEGVLLAVCAGVLAVGAAQALLPALLVWVPNGLPRTDVVRVDAAVVTVAVMLSLLAAVLATMIPAWASGRERLMAHLKDANRGGTTGGRRGARRAIVVGQVALAVVGLVGVGLLVGTVQQLRADAASLGADQLVIAPLVMPQTKYEDRSKWRRLVTTLVASIAADPRVSAATPVNATPFSGKGWETPVITAEGQSDDAARRNPSLNLEEVDPSYFQTFEVPIVLGRAFTGADQSGTPRVAIVTADVARQVWPGSDPLGKRLKWGSPASNAEWLTIVGIAAPTGYRDLRAPWPSLYVLAAQMLGAADKIVVRTTMPVAQLSDLVRAHLRTLDPEVQLMPLRPFDELLEEPIAGPRFYALLMTVFGMTGVGLAAVGLYGVVATSVRQRRREFGVRMALGAEARDVRRLVMADGAWLVGVGVLLGSALAVIAAQALRGLLHGVQPLHLPSFVAAAAGIAAVSALALAAPLRSAGRVEPSEVLRTE
jgi:putative ABC transport system permease protein